MAKDNFIILDGIPITKEIINYYTLENNFPDPNDKILVIHFKNEIKIHPGSETQTEFYAIKDVKVMYSDFIRFTSIHNPECAKLIDRFLAFYHKPINI
tara:strand:+ start:7171 stop:7464 length:294 start_codon:yes stop_codon:yes gene_type:complete